MQLLLSRRRFQERLDAAAVVGTLAPALQDRGMDNDRDVYKMCLAILTKACAKAPGAVIQNSDELLPALQRLLTIRPKEDAIPQEVRSRSHVQHDSTPAVCSGPHLRAHLHGLARRAHSGGLGW